MIRFMEMLWEFFKLPPLYEIGRTQILMPGDKDYPKRPSESIGPGTDRLVGPAKKEPEWLRKARLRKMRNSKPEAATNG